MTRTQYQGYLASREWALKREAVRQRAGDQCERYVSVLFKEEDFQVRCAGQHESTHHKTYANTGHEPLEDLMAVCNSCHRWLSGKTTLDITALLYKRFIDVMQTRGVRDCIRGVDYVLPLVMRDMLRIHGLTPETLLEALISEEQAVAENKQAAVIPNQPWNGIGEDPTPTVGYDLDTSGRDM